jgi:methionyl-tRNA formyltransferase
MKVVFFGSSNFSIPALRSISSLTQLVVTKRPKPKGRGYLMEDTEVKRVAMDLGLPLLEIDSFKQGPVHQLEEVTADLLVVASFGLIIPKWVLDLPAMGSINVHPSLLPRYRGPSPIQWAIWNGEEETGITFIKMNETLDAGDIVYQERATIRPEDDTVSLSERLSRRVAQILPGFIQDIAERGLANGEAQRHEEATYTPIITKEMGRIDWHSGAVEIVRQIRALVAWPAAYTYLYHKILKVFDGAVDRPERLPSEGGTEPGTILGVNRDGILVTTSNGNLVLKEVQMENKKRLRAYEFAQGQRNLTGNVLT